MATKWISPTWRMPTDTESPAGTGNNQSKLDNYSLEFDGSNYIDIASFTLDTPGASYSFWFYTDDITAAQGMFHIDGVATNTEMLIALYTSKIYVTNGTAATADSNSSSVLLSSRWYHVVVTRAAIAGPPTIYIDGVDDTNAVAGFWNADNTATSAIGKFTQTTGPAYFTGKLGQVAFFDYALTDGTGGTIDQVSDLYNSGTPSNPMALSPTPIAYYPLGESATGSSSTLTIPNESVPSATVFDFDGAWAVGANISLGTPPELQISSALTVSIWFKTTNNGMALITQDSGSSSTVDRNWHMYITGNKLKASCRNASQSGTTWAKSVLNVNDGSWHHAVMIYTPSTSVELWVDGDLVDTGTSNVESTINNGNIKTAIGEWGVYHGEKFIGEISNVNIWDSSLSGPDVTTLYNNGTPLLTGAQPQAANLKAWYPMNVDTSTWDGSDWIIGNAQANYTTAFNFINANSDYIESGSDINVGQTMTASIWLKTTQSFLSNTTIFGASGFALALFRNNSIFMYRGSSGDYSYTSLADANTSNINDGNWHNLIWYRSGNSTKVYVDGNEYNTTDIGTTSNDFNIRSISKGTGSWGTAIPFEGEMSNYVVWDSDQTAEAANIYNNGTPADSYTNTPILWWKLDVDNSTWDGSDWEVLDNSTNSNDGLSYGMTESNLVNASVSALNGISDGMTTANLVTSDLTRSIPYSSYSMNFDGTADYIDCGDSAIFSFGDGTTDSPFSFSSWVKLSSLTTNNTIVSKDTVTATTREYSLFVLTTGKVRVFIKNQGGYAQQSIDSTTVLSTGQWYHVVATYNGVGGNNAADGLTLYINGSAETPTNITKDAYVAMSDTTAPFIIGSYGSSNYMDGNISNVSVFNTALSEDQIITIYNGDVPNDISSLSPVSWWSLAGDSYYNGSDWICPDLGSGGNNGTSSGMGGTELVGDGPGSTANGIATSMDIPTNLKGEAPNSTSNAISINMTAVDRVTSVPG